MNVEKIISFFKSKGYAVFEDDTKNYNLNIFGIRSVSAPNTFDDIVGMFWKYQGVWTLRAFSATTDPGTFWLEHPMNNLGTGILKEGQYRGAYQIALHQGKYEALCQRKPVTVYRDADKDKELELIPGHEETGLFGLNIHRAAENGKSISVEKWSAACQVLQNREIFNPDNQSVKVFEFDYFMSLCKKGAENFGNNFTYTLINEKDIL